MIFFNTIIFQFLDFTNYFFGENVKNHSADVKACTKSNCGNAFSLKFKRVR